MRAITSSNNKKGWHFWGATFLLSLLSTNVAFCLDGEAILKALRDSNADTRRRALESPELAVCYSSDADEKNCPPNPGLFGQLNDELIRLLKDPDPSIRRVAAQYLVVSTDARAVKALAPLLRDVDENVREVATRGYVHFTVSDPAIVRELERLLKDNNKNVRKNAAMTLGSNGTRQSLDVMREAYSRETDPDVKKLFAETLKHLEKQRR